MEEDKPRGPKWIRKLVRESWQAELIISGAAIIGTVQLPGVLKLAQQYLLVNYQQTYLDLWFMATIYWAVFVYGLLLLFLYHFILRTLWIGLLGLKSRYPKGIARTNLTSEDFQDKAIAEYGDLDGSIVRLDQRASALFGTGFTYVSVFLNLGIILSLAVIVVSYLDSWGLSPTAGYVIVGSMLVSIVFMAIVSGTLSTPKFRDRTWVKKYHFPLTKVMNKLLYPVNHRYAMLGLNLTSSNSLREKYGDKLGWKHVLLSFLLILVVSGFAGFLLGVTDLLRPEFTHEYYWRMGDDPTVMDAKNYASSDYEGLLFEPQLNDRYLRPGSPLSVWVPLPDRELTVMLDGCSVAEVNDDDLSRAEARLARRLRTQTCAREYIELYLDDAASPLPLPEPLRQYRTTAGTEQFGVYLDLSDRLPAVGRHTLRVLTHLPESDEAKMSYRTCYIPFFVVDR